MKTEIGLAQLCVALKLYKKKYGGYPDSLGKLEGAVLKTLPKDPFTGNDYIYRKEKKGFLLYSLGENKKDDGGSEEWAVGFCRTEDLVWRIEK